MNKVKQTGQVFKLNEGAIKMICYAGDVVLITDTEDDLQRMLHTIYLSVTQFNMKLSVQKTL